MCKRINIFFPILVGFFFVMSVALSIMTSATGMRLEYWEQCILSEAILLAPALIYVAVFKIDIVACIPYRRMRWQDVLLSLLTGYLLIPVTLFINILTSLFATNYLNEESTVFTSYPFAVQIVLIALLPAMVEEFIFRGLIYHSYRRNGLVGAMVFSALAFGVMHMNLNQFFYAFVIGLFFAKMVEVTGSMWSSVLAHFAFNTFSITVSWIIGQAGLEDSVYTETDGATSVFLAGDPITTIVILIIYGVIAVIFLIFANMVINHMAKKNDRYEYMKYYTGMGLVNMNGEHFVTAPYAVTVILAFIYMVVIEIMQHL